MLFVDGHSFVLSAIQKAELAMCTFQDKQARALVRCLDKNTTDFLFVLRSFQQVNAKQRFENLAHVKDWLESTLKILLHTALLGTRSTWTP